MISEKKNRRKKPKKAKRGAYPEAVFSPLQLKMIKQVINEGIEADWSRWIAEAVERRIVKHINQMRNRQGLDAVRIGSKRGGPPVIGGAML